MRDVRERRGSWFRRLIGDLFMRDGHWEESKVFSVTGKVICAYMLLAFTVSLIDHEYVLMILLLAMIAPDLLKKFLSMRAGMRDSSNAATGARHRQRDQPRNTSEPDNDYRR